MGKQTSLRRSAFLLLLACLSSAGLCQSVRLKIALTIIDSTNRSDTIYFGVDPAATYCIDDSLGEIELPTDRCWGDVLDAAFFDVRSASGACLGLGVRLDLRKFISAAQTDTYKVSWCGWYPVKLTWPTGLGTYYDSVTIHDAFNSGPPIGFRANMLEVDSLVIPNSLFYSAIIQTWGPKGTTGVSADERDVPNQFYLGQNYPNPFNPSTKIRYELPKEYFVTLKIFDVLGREVTTLVDGRKSAGRYEVEWNAEGLASGVYYYQLRTPDFNKAKQLLLIR